MTSNKSPLDLGIRCPNCGRRLGLIRRFERCAYTGEVVCSRCIVSGRFSEKIASKIPKEFHEKFRIFDFLIWLAILLAGLFLMQSGIWTLDGWYLDDLDRTLYALVLALVRVTIGIVLTFLSIRAPRLGSWLFYWWIKCPGNKEKVDRAIAAFSKGEYLSENKLYNLKRHVIEYFERTKYAILHYVSLITNIAMVPLYFIVRENSSLEGTYFSAIVGLLYIVALVSNLLVLLVASAFYTRKTDDNKKKAGIIEWLSWSYIGQFPFMLLSLIASVLCQWNIIQTSSELSFLKPEYEKPFFIAHQVVFVLQIGFITILNIFMYWFGKPSFDLNSGKPRHSAFTDFKEYSKNFSGMTKIIGYFMFLPALFIIGLMLLIPAFSSGWTYVPGASLIVLDIVLTVICFIWGFIHQKKTGSAVLKRFFIEPRKFITTLVFLILILVFLALALLIMISDVTMGTCQLSPYILFMGIMPVSFVLLKLVKRNPKRGYTQPYWTVVKIGLVACGIFAVPMVMTPTVTNPQIDIQFSEVFGSEWRSRLPENYRQVPFSFFDMMFGFDIEVNAEYNRTYCYDSPRYVRSGDMVYNNGSEKNTSIVDSFVFDAYLPSDVPFGENQTDEVFPVVIFFHGIGMEFGIENVNWTSQYIANKGYLVCDMSYGYTGWTSPRQGIQVGRDKRRGYDFPDLLHHIGNFTKFLESNWVYYHADLNNVYFAGRSFGGWLAPVCAYGYNLSFFTGNFSDKIRVRGVIPYYGAHGILDGGSENFLLSSDAPYIRGSSDPSDPDYNPEWVYFNPYRLADGTVTGSSRLCPTLIIQGTNDYMVVPGWSKQLERHLEETGNKVISCYYPLGSHGFDALHFSPYGQSIIYYLLAFLALTQE
ncbi:MAG: hypothetical protein ACTSXP_04190 [Promethearchaeota archaeon]